MPFDRPQRATGGRLSVVSSARWLQTLSGALLDVHPFGGLRQCPATIDLLPYQLEPALAMFRYGHPRLLIADDVGMGKTIEAGLILRELGAVEDGVRALILVPAGLRQQWIDELARHFRIAAVNADASWLRTVGRSLPPELNPWSPPGTYIASFDFVKRPEALRPLEALRWDLVIVDEAHAATVATDRRAAIDAIAQTSQRVVLLTATPPGDAVQFAALCQIGTAADDGGPVVFQRGSTEKGSGRRSIVLATHLSEEERRLHRLLERYTTLVWREAVRSGNAHARLATIVLRKRALSSAGSLALSLRRRMELLAGLRPPDEFQLLLPLADPDDEARDEMASDEHARCGRSAGRCERATVVESHPRRRARGPAPVQGTRPRQAAETGSRTRPRLHGVSRHARGAARAFFDAAGIPVCVLHGGLTATERREALATLSRGLATLVATDAAAEGLNLQHACRLVIHFELPWNPMRMLQRAGRVDRLGQRRRVHEIALVAADTAEALVLAPLARRASGRLAGGGRRMLQLLTESRVAQSVFERRPCELPAEAAGVPGVHLDLAAESALEVHRLTNRRVLASSVRSPRWERSRPTTPVAVVRRSSLASGVVLLFDLKVVSAKGELVERALTALHIEMTPARWPRRPRQIRQQLGQYLPGLLRAASATLDRLARRQLDGVRGLYLESHERGQRRERAQARARDSAAKRLVQAGLFDRSTASWTARCPPEADLLESSATDDEPGLTASTDLRAVLLVPTR